VSPAAPSRDCPLCPRLAALRGQNAALKAEIELLRENAALKDELAGALKAEIALLKGKVASLEG
jgi:hypothetical protein